MSIASFSPGNSSIQEKYNILLNNITQSKITSEPTTLSEIKDEIKINQKKTPKHKKSLSAGTIMGLLFKNKKAENNDSAHPVDTLLVLIYKACEKINNETYNTTPAIKEEEIPYQATKQILDNLPKEDLIESIHSDKKEDNSRETVFHFKDVGSYKVRDDDKSILKLGQKKIEKLYGWTLNEHSLL